MKTTEELRSEFEETETFDKYNHWSFKFNTDNNMYFSAHLTYMSHSSAMNAAWFMFQELKK